ncbi:hypothetical protein ZOSMA_397G00080 [Zostera marina]|uniref:Uncharacterized protein n=1 Tax=Zostera marina TaxID=29655 RepID=A0A0K9P6G2_ZOSMR|nr:hypothetical protein ZOSMA_397G00080 [Zostera marina]
MCFLYLLFLSVHICHDKHPIAFHINPQGGEWRKFIFPADIYTIFLTVTLGVLAFLAEVFIARGLQLEKISKVTNILYLKVFLTQVCDMALDRDVQPSFGRLFGCILILASISSTLYTGPHKEAEYMFSPNDI